MIADPYSQSFAPPLNWPHVQAKQIRRDFTHCSSGGGGDWACDDHQRGSAQVD